jgi:hypothetical protein
MKKLEIILSQAIDEDFVRDCEVLGVGKHFTKSVGVLGQGNTSPKMGDNVWPELNNHYMLCVSDDEFAIMKTIIQSLRKKFPDEGVACFVTEATEI